MKQNQLWHSFPPGLPTIKTPGDSPNRGKMIGFKYLLIAVLPLVFCVMPLANPAKAKNKYDQCAASLMKLNLSPQQVAQSCSQSMYPENLASCVVNIAGGTDILAEDALATCRRVRRPLDLATCVVDISNVGTAADAPAILDHCRRSLLPVSFSQCVLGLVNQTDLGTTAALRYCIDGSDRDRNLNLSWLPTD